MLKGQLEKSDGPTGMKAVTFPGLQARGKEEGEYTWTVAAEEAVHPGVGKRESR